MITEVAVIKTGPLFNGQAQRAIKDATNESVKTVAQQGEQDIHTMLGQVLRNPTGYFESQVTTAISGDSAVIGDPVIYGAWLEGTGSRNKTTRFKGYATFRRVAQALENKVSSIGSSVFSRYEGRMN